MRRINRIILRTLAAIPLAMTLAGCIYEDGPNGANCGMDNALTITVRVPVASDATRAYPTAGEDGEGREDGMANENDIFDANIFFYKGEGMNQDDAGNVEVYNVYIPNFKATRVEEENLPFEKKITFRIPLSETGLTETDLTNGDTKVSFITVLNAGSDLSDIKDLSDLRSYSKLEKSWTSPSDESISALNYSHFVMTTAYDAPSGVIGDRRVGSSLLVRDENTKDGWKGETTVERICARIDLLHNNSFSSTGDGKDALIYEVKKGDDILAEVWVTDMLPVNAMQQPSFLIRKTTTGLPAAWTESGLGTIKWGGLETTTLNGKPSNYVIEPHTLLKESETTNTSGWYATSSVENVQEALSKKNCGAIADYYTTNLSAPEHGCSHFTVIGYANENIQSPAKSDSRFVTGVAIRAEYRPMKWHSYEGGNLASRDMSREEWLGKEDKSFTRYQPTLSNGANALEISEENALYFAKYEDAQKYAEAHPADQAILTRFEGGVCYYNLWLRHYDDTQDSDRSDPHAPQPMQYAIVRNNLYRFAISFSGPGDIKPELREPETMAARIFVRKWNTREEKKPLEF